MSNAPLPMRLLWLGVMYVIGNVSNYFAKCGFVKGGNALLGQNGAEFGDCYFPYQMYFISMQALFC